MACSGNGRVTQDVNCADAGLDVRPPPLSTPLTRYLAVILNLDT